jgi:large subunit ribosomal protein L23
MKHLVQRPLITEKSLAQARAQGWYAFAVVARSRKEDIAEEIKQLYNVDVVEIRTVKRTGKMRRAGRKQNPVKRPDWKKAMVRLAKGQRIAVFEVGEEKPAA